MSGHASSTIPLFWAPTEPLPTAYHIEVQIDFDKQILTGTERLTLMNTLAVPLHKLALQSGHGRGERFQIRSNGQKSTLVTQPAQASGDVPLLLELCDPLEPGGSMEWVIDFRGPLPAPRYGAWMLRDWHPRLGTLAMPLPVEARFQDGSVQRGIVDRILPATEIFFESTSPLVEAVLDPDEALPLLEALPKPTSQEVQREIAELEWTGVGDKARQVFLRAQECSLDIADQWCKMGLVLYDAAYYCEALEAFQRAANRSEDATCRVVSWVWQGHLLDLLDRREEALEWYRKAHETRFSGRVQHGQYGIVAAAVDRPSPVVAGGATVRSRGCGIAG